MTDPTRTTPDPDPTRLTPRQTQGKDCTRCGDRTYNPVRIGTATRRDGTSFDLIVCGGCATPDEQVAHRQAIAGTAAGYCVLCEGWAQEAVLIGLWAANSGPGWSRYAHRACAEREGVRILDDEA